MKNILQKSFFGGLLILLSFSSFVFGQITLTYEDAPSTLGTKFEMSSNDNDSIEVDLESSGENVVWDFSNLDLPFKTLWTVIDPATSPFNQDFPDANVVYEVTSTNSDTITYNYIRITENDLTELGLGAIAGDDVVRLVVPKATTPKLHLPVTYGVENWSSVLEVDTSFIGMQVTLIDSTYNSVDAWGTIKTEMGDFQCLRIRQNHKIIVISTFATLVLENNINYFWVANSYGIIATVTGMNNDEPVPDYSLAKSINVMTSFTPTGITKVENHIPAEFELLQNYPNPFNPGTTISYQLNEQADVVLTVFNLAGETILSEKKNKLQSGKYNFYWDAGNLPSGTYFYRIQTNRGSQIKKCVLMK